MKKRSKYLIAFLIPFLIFLCFLLYKKFVIHQDFSLLTSDLELQYQTLFTYLRRGGNLIYSFTKGFGGSMFGTFTYYLASPLNLIIYLFPLDRLPLALTLIILLKVSLSGLTMYIYLKNKVGHNKLIYIFTTCYSLMAFMINYHFNIIWLDGVFYLPLILLGIDRILDKKSPLVYIIFLALSILSNYYIGYMICIMSLIYFTVNFLFKYNIKKDKQIIFKFLLSSILVALIMSFLLIPSALELRSSYKVGEVVNYTGFNLNIFDLFSRAYPGSQNYENVLCQNIISIYCGLITIPLLYLYFTNKKINKKEKKLDLIILLILLSGFFIPAINNVWHLFNNVSSFSFRYSFIICFYIIYISYKSILNIDKIDKKQLYIFLIIYLFISMIVSIKNYDYLNNIIIYVSCFLMFIYLILLHMNDSDSKKLLILLVCAELFFNVIYSLKDYDYYSFDSYDYNINEVKKITDELKDNNYRLERDPIYTKDDSILLDYKGINNFLSTNNSKLNSFLINMGYFGTSYENRDYNKNTIFIDSVLGLKYKISKKIINYNQIEEISLKDNYNFTFEDDVLSNYYINENPYALKIGYMINYSPIEYTSDPFLNQNRLLNSIFKTNLDYLVSYEGIDNKFYINNDELVYVYYPSKFGDGCKVYINDKLIDKDSKIFSYKNNLNGQYINVSAKCEEQIPTKQAYAYYINLDLFKEQITKIQNQLDIIEIKGNYLKGEIEVTNDMDTLLLTIPYDEGLKVYVDGKETQKEELYDTFTGIKLSKGRHIIELKYQVPGLKIGIIMSIIGIFTLLLYTKCKKNID